MIQDAELIRRYAADGNEAAFRELVSRHLNLVYSAALRQLDGDSGGAEDVAQAVFTDLARKADALGRHPSIKGWLFTSTHFAAAKFRRAEKRRRNRETEAQMTEDLSVAPPSSDDWTQLRPIIDAALLALAGNEREVILLRFFGELPLREVGQQMGLSENAAQKQVTRAMESLRRRLAAQGITSTTAALGVLLASQSVLAAPVRLGEKIVSSTLAQSASEARQWKSVKPGSRTVWKATVGAPIGMTLAIGGLVFLGWHLVGSVRNHRFSQTASGNSAARGVPVLSGGANPVAGMKSGNETNVRVLLSRARELERAGRLQEAISAYSVVIAVDARSYEAYFERGCIYGFSLPSKQRNHLAALADFTEALKIKPNDASARSDRALEYQALGLVDKAIADYTELLEGDTDYSHMTNPDQARALDFNNRGRLLEEEAHDPTDALADYDEALRLDPNTDLIHMRKGVALEDLKQYGAAEAEFAAAVKQDPGYPNALSDWAWLLATAPNDQDRDGANAVQLALKANEIFKFKDAEQLDVLAAAYAESGRFDEAVAAEQKAIAAVVAYQAKLKPEMQARLGLYQAKSPYRQP